MEKGKKMVIIIAAILGVLGLLTWGAVAYLGRGQTLTVTSIENPSGDLHLIRLKKPDNLTWKPGSYAKFKLPDVKENEQNSRWLTIASTTDENEILILTHDSGSFYKKTLTGLSVGSEVEMSWLQSLLLVTDDEAPLVCFASDVGVAALRPIIKEWVGRREIIFSHLDKGVTVFDDEMARLAHETTTLTYEVSGSLD